MRGETRRKARSRYSGDEALRRVSPRRRRERRRREREGGRDPEHRAELDQRCQARSRSGPQPSGPKQGVASCAGLAPEAVYVYGERGEGRTNRPPCTGSTVAPTVTARCQANHTRTGKPRGGKGSDRTIEIRACGQPRRRGPSCEETPRLPLPETRTRQARTPTSRCRSSRRRSRRPS